MLCQCVERGYIMRGLFHQVQVHTGSPVSVSGSFYDRLSNEYISLHSQRERSCETTEPGLEDRFVRPEAV